MLKYYRIILLLIGFILITGEIYAQPPHGGGKHMMKRVAQMKKVKLLEVLQLSEEENNAFLAKYSTYDNKISESMQLIFELSQNLKKEIKDNSKPEEISKLTSQLIAEQKKLDDLRNENLIEMGKVLSKEAYPKFVYFELNFQQEVMREIMKNRERPDQDGDKPKRRMRFNQD